MDSQLSCILTITKTTNKSDKYRLILEHRENKSLHKSIEIMVTLKTLMGHYVAEEELVNETPIFLDSNWACGIHSIWMC